MKKKRNLTSKEKEILSYIHDTGGTATTHEIANNTGISYITVRKYIDRLVKDKILVEVKGGKKKKQN